MMNENLKIFKRKDVIKWLEKLGSRLKSKVTIYLVGGGAMSLKGIKKQTKDIDLVIMTKREFNDFKKALTNMKYQYFDHYEEADFYKKPIIVFRKGGVRIDVFIKDIAGQLEFNKFMRKKAKFYKEFDNLKVMLASKEDIFLSKCLTDREKDVDDCFALINEKLNYKLILKELKMQEKRRKILWRFWIYEQLSRIENKYGRPVPIKKNIWKLLKEEWDRKPESFMENIKDRTFEKEIAKK